ncbi:bifunctional histidinol-phosphatase/imidazoleglycerol-phosphate dehydratase [Blattabacterium sp. (Cryptocercus kyebangensis)]|uniref:bifunctional histidinol-phosphatase/imidazoleglycerol-phosphate dehydratase HisB n=1 Tax=Blattabacterium sp. (Cryptocercus kyebangensis) TaxID=298656 RepID=UPI000D7C4B6D|nr:bifunctional histidinol-phosphatase/imidazoleglycerol-phosphate dehydratase HisB [Blattabacterium sp. (Cryptocercus kyebangensis)]AWU43828.1 bifunctional histidinol-phosphatase/imidazoleglycerol-phosphate dehydratase [Blattabacterium sp. (Cryptocercus kyebangensis)]
MKKILFIDRDGTIIQEFPPTYQIDTLEKVNFYPKVIFFLTKIVDELDYDLVMVTNQDGLGTEKFPEKNFWPIHNHILKILKTEGINFSSIHIDKSIPEENSSTRKPGIGMLTSYFHSDYDLSNSFVIGDRITDVLLAKNLGCKSIWIRKNHNLSEKKFSIEKKNFKKVIVLKTDNWKNVYEYLKYISHKKLVKHRRTTLETDVRITIQLYGEGKSDIKTGLDFFDHLLEQLSFHSMIDMNIHTKGDLNIDEHHTIEDTAITLGEIFHKSIIDKKGIERYGFFSVPMDDCLSTVVLDLGGRSELSWKTKFLSEKIGKVPTEMFIHFFKSFSSSAKCNIHIHSTGKNDHHKIESIFKAFARAIKMAIKKNNTKKLPSSKGLL